MTQPIDEDVTLPPPPYTSSFLDQNGSLSISWLTWLRQLYLRVGQAVAPSNTQILVNPMTTFGDMLFENGTPAIDRLPGNSTATKNFLTQTGTGSVSANPSWGTIQVADVPILNQNTTGSAATATTATNATNAVNIGITDDTATNATMYPVWVTNSTGNLPARVTSTKFSFNPSTGTLSMGGTINMGSHKITSVTDPTAAQDAATKNYVDNVAAGINPAVAVQAATTAAGDTSGLTYNNGVSGIGATFTGAVNTALTIDGYTFTAVGQRLLVKNDTQAPSGAFNGVYYVTQIQTLILAPILTRALDYDMPSDINNTGAIPVINGTVNGTTQWVLTSQINTVGTDALTYVKFTRNPADYLLVANNLSDVAVKATAFNNISPMTTSGDVIYGGTSGAGTRLAKGSNGDVLTLAAGLPSWAAPAGGVTEYSWSGYHTSAPTWSRTNTAFGDYSASGTPAIVEKTNTNFGTVTTAGSSLPGLTFSPPVTGNYFISFTFCFRADNGTNAIANRLYDGTTVIWEQAGGSAGGGSNRTELSGSGIWNAASTSSVTIKLQAKADAGQVDMDDANGTGSPIITWTIFKLH